MGAMSSALTAWGKWVRSQPRGTMRRAELATKLAYSTIHYALTQRTSRKVAELLSEFSGGAVRVDAMAKRRKPRARSAA
jgi:hypothetical protein